MIAHNLFIWKKHILFTQNTWKCTKIAHVKILKHIQMYDMSTYNIERGHVPHVEQQLLEAIVRHAQML